MHLYIADGHLNAWGLSMTLFQSFNHLSIPCQWVPWYNRIQHPPCGTPGPCQGPLSASVILMMITGDNGDGIVAPLSWQWCLGPKFAYCQTSNIRHKIPKLKCFPSNLVVAFAQSIDARWRCSWSSADRWCSNYIHVINNFIPWEFCLSVHQLIGNLLYIVPKYGT